MATYDDRTYSQRREIKYLIPESLAQAIQVHLRPFMRPDAYSSARPGEGYPIASLYLDSPDWRLCRQTAVGEKNRFKLRVRTYSDEPATPVYLEIKRRLDQIIFKERAALDRRALDRCLGAGRGPSAEESPRREVAAKFFALAAECGAVPAARVRYRREAYESRDDLPVRMTFDRAIEYAVSNEPTVGLNGPGWTPVRLDGVVFEIKFTGGYPSWVERMVRRFGLEARSIPKYVLAVSQARRLPEGLFDWVRG